MAYKLIHETNAPFSNLSVNKFIIDSADDVKDLPRSAPSSTAIVAQLGGGSFIVNASGEWVELRSASAREILLGDAGAYKQLVTNGDGEKVWEERLCYSYIQNMPILMEKTYEARQEIVVAENNLIPGEEYSVFCNDVEYKCIATVKQSYGICLGNFSSIRQGEDTGEPFFAMMLEEGATGYLLFNSNGSHKLSIDGPVQCYETIPSEYLPCYVKMGTYRDSTVLNSNKNVASGRTSIAGGMYTKASGTLGVAFGLLTEANGLGSFAEGDYTIASGDYQHVQGKFNLEDADGKYVHIIGNGPDDSHRSNAYTLDWDGNAWFAGSVDAKSLIIASPNGTRFKVTVSDDGVLGVESIAE